MCKTNVSEKGKKKTQNITSESETHTHLTLEQFPQFMIVVNGLGSKQIDF